MATISDNFRRVVAESADKRRKVRADAAAGRPIDGEDDQIRAAEFVSRQITANLPGAEALIGPTNDLQGVWFLSRGAEIRRAVAMVEVNLPRSSDRGSGFLISPTLFITNQHVVPDLAAARATRVIFDFERDGLGLPTAQTIFALDPDRFSLFSPIDQLDYAIIAVGPRLQGNATLDELGYCFLSGRDDKHAIGMSMNVIEHPNGLPKMIALRNNLLTYRTPRTLLYESDTDHGSSGSPVFNDFWEVVALHHYGEPFLELKDENGQPVKNTVNEGVRISSIYAALAALASTLPAAQKALLDEALAYDNAPPAGARPPVLKPARPDPGDGGEALVSSGVPVMASSPNEVRLTIPLEISIRVAAPQPPQASREERLTTTASAMTTATATMAAWAAAPPAAKALRRGAEVLHVDEDYSNRSGYESKFIPGQPIPLPQPSPALAKSIAPLIDGSADAASGELKYEHFSVTLHKKRRMAIFTATNIDGKTYLEVDRATGQVKDGAEADKWFDDPRVDKSAYLGLSFYSEWSHYFDRGHLTRRTDPTWGTPEEAEKANVDTFHLSNCSPQHFRFNESAKFWQGAERYVLENGVLDTDSLGRICVFQGPIFDSSTDMMADDVQIPAAFFKVIVWKGKGGLRSVGLVVDQSALMSETRVGLVPPKSLPNVKVGQWRVPITSIEKRTKLDFGDAVRNADTIKSPDQPHVGEAIFAVNTYADLLPPTY